MEKARKLADILDRVRSGEDPAKIRQQARQLLATLRLSDISKAHKYLVGTGISLDQLRTLVTRSLPFWATSSRCCVRIFRRTIQSAESSPNTKCSSASLQTLRL
jgi:DUF438 domain-containing protein